MSENFFLLCDLHGLKVYTLLTNEQIYATDDSWNEDRVMVFEDRAGEMVPYDNVLVSDLEIIEEV